MALMEKNSQFALILNNNGVHKRESVKTYLFYILTICFFFCSSCSLGQHKDKSHNKLCKYKEVSYPTPNIAEGKTNDIKGVILHHTAEPTIQSSLKVLTVGQRHVGTHVVIDTNGTRYIMAKPTDVTYHAGKSILAGREGCNDFTIGVEFQGNTLETPLTLNQIKSCIEYLLPLIKKYKIPIKNIVTHEMIRNAYKKKYPNNRCYGKVDITQAEYRRFMKHLQTAIKKNKIKTNII